MAHQAIPPLDSFNLVGRDDALARASETPQAGEDAATAFSQLDSMSSAKADRTSFADLALDLVLNEIVLQARLATTATGATIRLLRGGEIVCRAAAVESNEPMWGMTSSM